MDGCKQVRGVVPKRIQVDNVSEFIWKALDPFIESFNGSFRDECLNVNWFLSLEDAREKIEAFKDDYDASDCTARARQIVRRKPKGISVMPGHDLPEPDDYSIRIHVG